MAVHHRRRSESDLSAYHSRGSELSSLERTRQRTDSFASGRVGSPPSSPRRRSFSSVPPLTPTTALTHSLGEEEIHGFRGAVSMDSRASGPHARLTAELDPTEDSEEVLDFELVHEGSRDAGKVHGTPVLSFTLGVDRAGRAIEDSEENIEKTRERTALFGELKDILHEQRPIEYSITHHEITAYDKQPDGTIVKKRYSLNLDEDVLRLLKDNGIVAQDATLETPGVRERVDEKFKVLEEVNQDLLNNTKHLTGSSSRTWARNVLGSNSGPSLTLTSSGLVNSVFGKQDYREKLLKKRFCDPKYGFVEVRTKRVRVPRAVGNGHVVMVEKDKKVRVLTERGAKTLQKMEEAQRFRNNALRLLNNQLEIRQAQANALRGSDRGPEDAGTELPRLEREIHQIKSVIKEIHQTPEFVVDWTIMMQERDRSYTVPAQGPVRGREAQPRATVHESGRELMTEHDGDSRYADWSVKQSEEDLTELMTEAGTRRQKWYHIRKSKPELSPEDQRAMATVASLPYFIHANADRDDSMPMQFAHRRYLESHGAQMPKVPTVALVLFGAAQTVCEGEHFNLRGLGKGLPPIIDRNGDPVMANVRENRQHTFASVMQEHLTTQRAAHRDHPERSSYQVGRGVPEKLLAAPAA